MSNEVTTVDELRAIVGHPIEAVAKKVTDRLSGAHRLWLAHSPLGFVATTDAQGRVDGEQSERDNHGRHLCANQAVCQVRRLLDGLQVDATIQHERAANFDFHTGRAPY